VKHAKKISKLLDLSCGPEFAYKLRHHASCSEVHHVNAIKDAPDTGCYLLSVVSEGTSGDADRTAQRIAELVECASQLFLIDHPSRCREHAKTLINVHVRRDRIQ
jgi:hypothetical protein